MGTIDTVIEHRADRPRLSRRAAAARSGRRPSAVAAAVALLLAFVGAILLAPSTAAHATAPVELNGAYVVDKADVLSGSDQSKIEAAVKKTQTDTGITLLVVFVPTFTDPSDRAQWGSEMATLNSLGQNDVLLSVAVTDRLYDVQKSTASSLTTDQLASIEKNDLVPQLRDRQWGAAAVALATGIDDAQGPADLSWIPIALLVVLVIAAIVVIVVVTRRRRSRRALEAEQAASQAELDRRAGALLVGIDDQITQASQEVDFASAQFGDAAAAPFAQAVESAKARVRQAFELRQQLDDEIPDTPQQKREWTEQIIALCEAAHGDIEAQSEAYDRLRASEATVVDDTARLRADIQAAEARSGQSTSTLAALTSTYSARAVASISGNPQQVAQLLEFAGQRASDAEAQIQAGSKGEAVGSVQRGRQALVQVGQLLDAIDKAGATLSTAQASIDAATADLRSDIQAAQKVPAGAVPQGADLAGAVSDVQAALGYAEANRADPLSVLDRLSTANTRIDTTMATVRDAEVSRQRVQAALDQALLAARGQISSARDFIETRRGAISAGPLTRLSEAERHLSTAVSLATADPNRAVAEAQQAGAMANAAVQDADAEVGAYQQQGFGGSPFGGGYGGYGRGGGGGANLGGILTGVLIGGLLNGGGGGFGGGGWGGGGGDGGGFGGGDFGGGGGDFGGGGGGGGGGFDDSGGRF